MAGRQRVLVVDGPWETEEVLKAVLEPRGLDVQRVRNGRELQNGGDAGAPRVVVIHEEQPPGIPTASGSWGGVPRVIIGSAAVSPNTDPLAGHHYLPFPFQYRDLIQAVERLLSGSEQC